MRKTSIFGVRLSLSTALLGLAPAAIGVTPKSPDPCTPTKVKVAAQGYVCRTSKNVNFKLETKTTAGSIVLRDLTSGVLISDRVGDRGSQYSAENLCAARWTEDARGNLKNVAWRLPTGYPENLNGSHGFPQGDSDFVTLEKHGVREAVSLDGRWFWSSSISPNDLEEPESGDEYAYNYSGFHGIIGSYDRKGEAIDSAVICVGEAASKK